MLPGWRSSCSAAAGAAGRPGVLGGGVVDHLVAAVVVDRGAPEVGAERAGEQFGVAGFQGDEQAGLGVDGGGETGPAHDDAAGLAVEQERLERRAGGKHGWGGDGELELLPGDLVAGGRPGRVGLQLEAEFEEILGGRRGRDRC